MHAAYRLASMIRSVRCVLLSCAQLEGPSGFTFYDVFFWRDAPDWYRKTFISAGFGLTYCTLKQYLNRCALMLPGTAAACMHASASCGAAPRNRHMQA